MFSRFFIERPIFATVMSIVIVLAGLMAMRTLPIAQFPSVVPPEVVVNATYPGASAQDVAEAVAAPLEQAINGTPNMLYMTSTTSDSGTLSISVTFAIGTDPDQASIDVNNRVQSALSQVPQSVRQQGVTAQKRSSSILQVVALYSPDQTYDKIFISNYALVNIMTAIKRIDGVGDARLFGAQDYAMRIWMDPQKLAEYDLTPSDVAAAVGEQNSQFAAGSFGAMPTTQGKEPAYTYTATTAGRFSDPEQFEDIILRAGDDGSILRLSDVARVELGAQGYGIDATYNGQSAVPFGIFLSPGANALQVATAVEQEMALLSERFPPGLEYEVPYDTTIFVNASIESVMLTFVEALILVVLVVYLFLQNLRATLIPLLAIPISVIGTFAGMYLLGFSINLLTLFGLILAIGIVVDDAIIVIENVERIMTEEGKSPREAAIKAMREVSGPVVAVVLVLAAVFVPVGFLGGLSGQMYSQFAITIAVSVAISGLVALTLTPALCAAFLKPSTKRPAWPFRKFNQGFEKLTGVYMKAVSLLLRRIVLGLVLFGVFGLLAWMLSTQVPSTLVPQEDQGSIFASITLPPASSLTRTNEARDDFTALARERFPAISDITAISGYDLIAGARQTNAGIAFMTLKPWGGRTAADQSSFALVDQIMALGREVPQARIQVFNPPPIQGLSATGGFEGFIQNTTGADYGTIEEDVAEVVAAASERPELAGVRTTLTTGVPRYSVDADREQARALGVSIAGLFSTMQATFGTLYVNDFTYLGRNFQVRLQSQYEFRGKPEDLRHVFVRSDTTGDMIPLSSLVSTERVQGASIVQRFNVFPAAKILGSPAPGYSSGQAIDAMQAVVAETLGEGYQLSWTGTAYQEQAAGGTAVVAIGFGLIMVFLILAAQYERWTLPLTVVAAVPFALFGAFLAVWLRGVEQSIYIQVGLLVLIGLAAKNAILIVEFAVISRNDGKSYRDAAMEAARLRFRPIIMTSLAFILGVVPLAIATGASAASRQAIGTAVIGGMLAATFLATIFVPMFYEVIEQLSDRITGRNRDNRDPKTDEDDRNSEAGYHG